MIYLDIIARLFDILTGLVYLGCFLLGYKFGKSKTVRKLRRIAKKVVEESSGEQ